jgi:hypothetical protein
MENKNLSESEEPTEEQLEEMEEEVEDDEEETREDNFEAQQDLAEDYPYPEQEEKHNSHFIINKALEKQDTVRTTFLTESELGKPLFSVRFLADLHDDALRANSEVKELTGKQLRLEILENYYYEKIQNITSTGMSNKGFMMNLNVTHKREATKRRLRIPSEYEKK